MQKMKWNGIQQKIHIQTHNKLKSFARVPNAFHFMCDVNDEWVIFELREHEYSPMKEEYGRHAFDTILFFCTTPEPFFRCETPFIFDSHFLDEFNWLEKIHR